MTIVDIVDSNVRLRRSYSVSQLNNANERQEGVEEEDGEELSIAHASNFIQILDESMCVVRDDLTDWLQRYLFDSSSTPPLSSSAFLLDRLWSGLWLSRLAYKLHHSVFTAPFPIASQRTDPGHQIHRQPIVLRLDTARHEQLGRSKLPDTLDACSRLRLGKLDIEPEPVTPQAIGAPTRRIADQWTARNNVTAFIEWCSGQLRLPSTILFETTGLVHRTEEKNVILTLVEVARLASRVGLTDLPDLVRMELEIDQLEAARVGGASGDDGVVDATPLSTSSKVNVSCGGDGDSAKRGTAVGTGSDSLKSTMIGNDGDNDNDEGSLKKMSSTATTQTTTDKVKSRTDDHSHDPKTTTGYCQVETDTTGLTQDAQINPPSPTASSSSMSSVENLRRTESDLYIHDKVKQKVAACRCCTRLKVLRLTEGRYKVGSHVYYFRRFRKHVMVRVGGGWLTLEAFFSRYDPCQQQAAVNKVNLKLEQASSTITTSGRKNSSSTIPIGSAEVLKMISTAATDSSVKKTSTASSRPQELMLSSSSTTTSLSDVRTPTPLSVPVNDNKTAIGSRKDISKTPGGGIPTSRKRRATLTGPQSSRGVAFGSITTSQRAPTPPPATTSSFRTPATRTPRMTGPPQLSRPRITPTKPSTTNAVTTPRTPGRRLTKQLSASVERLHSGLPTNKNRDTARKP